MKLKARTFEPVKETFEDNCSFYSNEKGLRAIKLPTGTVVDFREKTPFLSFSPCSYCGCLEDKAHIANYHVDKRLGVKI